MSQLEAQAETVMVYNLSTTTENRMRVEPQAETVTVWVDSNTRQNAADALLWRLEQQYALLATVMDDEDDIATAAFGASSPGWEDD